MQRLAPVLPAVSPALPDSGPASSPKTSPSEVAWPSVDGTRGDYRRTIYTVDLWKAANVPERHRDRHTLRWQATGPWRAAFDELAPVVAEGGLVVLLGKRGTGKTQLAVCLLAEACRAGKTGRYLKALDLFREIRNCYRKDGPSELETVDKLCGLGCLVLDEAHERSDSEWENRTLTNIIDRRYDAVRSTVLVSNMDKAGFAESVGPSIVSRIHECGRTKVCDWASFRTPSPAA